MSKTAKNSFEFVSTLNSLLLIRELEMNKLTTAFGAPVVDNQNIQTAGPRGPALLQDIWFLEKLAHFDREVIPERCMHAKARGLSVPADPEADDEHGCKEGR